MIEFAKAGKRIVFVCSSKTKGASLYERLLKEGFRVMFHSSEDGKEEKEVLLNVREEWAKYQIVIYTTTITVGVSYSNVSKEAEFDELFLYATASCALPRDIAQALLRARVIKSNQLWFCIEKRCVKSSSVGLVAVEESMKARKDLLAMSGVAWEKTPAWIQRLIVMNENEIAVSRNYFSLLLKRYLRDSGNTLVNPILTEELLEMSCGEIGKPFFEEIELLEAWEIDGIEEKIMNGEATKEEKLQLLKYKFLLKFTVKGREEIAPNVWNTMFTIEDKKKTLEQQFWNIVHEKQRDLGHAWKAEAASRYAEQARGSLLKQTTMKELCQVLGIAHSCEEKSWSHQEFETLAPEILKLEEKLRKVMGLRASRSKKKESELMQASDVLKQVLEAWSASTVKKNTSRKRKDGKICRFNTVTLVPYIKNMYTMLN